MLKIKQSIKRWFTLVEMMVIVIILGFWSMIVAKWVYYLYDMFLTTTKYDTYQHISVALSNFQNYSNQYFRWCTIDNNDNHFVRCYNTSDKNYYKLEINKDKTSIIFNLYNDEKTEKLNILNLVIPREERELPINWEKISNVYEMAYFSIKFPNEQLIYFDTKI